MPEAWGAGPGLMKRLERNNAAHKQRKRMIEADERSRRAARAAKVPAPSKTVTTWVGVLLAAAIIAGLGARLFSGTSHASPSMSNLQQNVQYRADVALQNDGSSETIKSVLCVPSGTRQARCHLTASDGTQTSVTAYLSANGKSFVTGP